MVPEASVVGDPPPIAIFMTVASFRPPGPEFVQYTLRASTAMVPGLSAMASNVGAPPSIAIDGPSRPLDALSIAID